MVRKVLLGLLGVVVLLLVGGYVYYKIFIFKPPLISEEDRVSVTIMPLPATLKIKSESFALSNGIQIRYTQFSNERLEKAVDRFVSGVKLKTGLDVTNEKGQPLEINCSQSESDGVQQAREDESYSLKVTSKHMQLEAPSTLGILRGLESLQQLIAKQDNVWGIPALEISDNPRFPWRGLMLDVCRHWMPKDVVLRVIDAMAAVKLNVFHWHLSEDQGFRVESKVFPRLHEIGSNGKFYTQDEIREVINYAADRGIRVVPEFDLPGHSKSWQIAYPELSSVNSTLGFGTKGGVAFAPPLDPTKESVYEFLDKFVGEMSTLFPDPYFHIGGDEVNPKYWNENLSIQEFMKVNGLKDAHDLQAYFNKRMHQIIEKHGKRMLGWDEILHPDLGDDIVVQSWRSHKSLFEAVQKGGTAILSSGWYLDLILPAGKHYEVDPLVLEGAVDIIPDTTHWKMYNMVLEVGDNEMESQLVIFDRDSTDLFGFFAMMGDRTVFRNGTFLNDNLHFNFDGPMGEMTYQGTVTGDSLLGKISFGLLGLNTGGIKSGGSDMPGTVMPKIEVMKPLTNEEQSRIIGGEACQWAEFVDSINVESRIWPRAAAIAEKLWSPQELTKDTDDMYRRLEKVSEWLSLRGSTHDTQYEMKLRKLVPNEGFEYLKTIADVLEEVKYHGRMTALMQMDYVYLPDFKLDRVVDAVRPESMEARAFNKLVDEYYETKDTDSKEKIKLLLKKWQENHALLSQYFSNSEKLQDIENISLELSEVSDAAIAVLDGRQVDLSKSKLMEKLSFLENGENGVIVAVVPGLRKIISQM